jgi:DNA-binding transcriptional LysR family regulator
MIDPRLQALRVLHEQGTVTATAKALHLTPSTVSQQLRQLAAELRVQLLEPDGRRVRLTPAALTLLGHADVLHAQWEAACADLSAHRDGTAGRLRMTGFATAVTSLIAPAAAELRRRHPQMTLVIGENATVDRFHLLLTDSTDIAVVMPTADTPPPDDSRYQQIPVLEEPQDLLVPDGHSFAGRAPEGIELAEAAAELWVTTGDLRDQNRLMLTACAAAGFTPRTTHEALDWYAVSALVEHGFGICLIPRLAPVLEGCAVTRVPLRGAVRPRRRLVAAIRRGSERHLPIARGLEALLAAAETHRPEP